MAAGKHKPADSLRDGEKELGRRRMRWFCVHHDMVTDPKWRLVARRSGRPLTEVLAVALALMTNASQNESARGSLKGWSDDVQAVALDMEAEHLAAIRLELEGLVMDGDSFTGWAKRQLKRDDDSRDRTRSYRERRRGEAATSAGQGATPSGGGVTSSDAKATPSDDLYSDSHNIKKDSVSPNEQEAAREGGNRDFDDEGGVWCEPMSGLGMLISASARSAVEAKLAIEDAQPLVEQFRSWQARKPLGKRARDPDALFFSSAPKLYANLSDFDRQRCRPKPEVPLEITVRPVQASAELVANLRGGRVSR